MKFDVSIKSVSQRQFLSDNTAAGLSSVKALKPVCRWQALFVTSSFSTVTEHVPTGVRHLSVWVTWKSWLFTLLQVYTAGFLPRLPSAPSVTVLPCHGRSSSRVKGLIQQVHARAPLQSAPGPRGTPPSLRSMQWDRAGGILRMPWSLCPPPWGSRTFWLKPAHRGILGFQVLKNSFLNDFFCFMWLWDCSKTTLSIQYVPFGMSKSCWSHWFLTLRSKYYLEYQKYS